MRREYHRALALMSGKWLALLFLCSGFYLNVSAQPSASEILKRAEEVMTQTSFKCVLIKDGKQQTVFHKKTADGSIASRAEESSPVQRITIINSQSKYDIFPDQRVIVDAVLLKRPKSYSAISAALPVRVSGVFVDSLIGTTNLGGKSCFSVESRVPEEAIALALKNIEAEAAKYLPEKYHFLVDKDTYCILVAEEISKAKIRRVEFKNIEPLPSNLPEEFFQPPGQFEIKKPGSSSEYGKLIGQLSRPPMTPGRDVMPPAAATTETNKIDWDKFREEEREKAILSGLQMAKEMGSKLTYSNFMSGASNEPESSPVRKKTGRGMIVAVMAGILVLGLILILQFWKNNRAQ